MGRTSTAEPMNMVRSCIPDENISPSSITAFAKVSSKLCLVPTYLLLMRMML